MKKNRSALIGLLDQIELGKSPFKTHKKNLKTRLSDYLRGELTDRRPSETLELSEDAAGGGSGGALGVRLTWA